MILKSEAALFQLPEIMNDVEVFIGQPYYITKVFLDKLPNLKWIQITGAGYDKVDMDEVKKRNIRITNTRGAMSTSIAEDIFCKMLYFSRRVGDFVASKANRTWENFGSNQWMCSILNDLSGKTIGLIGDGSISNKTAKRARAFEMTILTYGRTDKKNPNFDEFLSGKEGLLNLAQRSDFIVVSIPFSEETYHLLDGEFIDNCKESTIIINVARGGVIDEEALIDALINKRIKGAALDVFEVEPLPVSSKLWDLPNVFITSHKAGVGDTWIIKMSDLIATNLKKYKEGQVMKNEIIDYKSE